MNRRLQVFKYIVLDYLAAAVAWFSFFAYRKLIIETEKFGDQIPVQPDAKLFLGLLLIPLYWIAVYFVTGTYHNIYRRARLNEVLQTLQVTFIGVLGLFFLLLPNEYSGI